MNRTIVMLTVACGMLTSIGCAIETSNNNENLIQFPTRVESADSNSQRRIPDNTVTFQVEGGPFSVGDTGEIRIVANVGDRSIAAYDFRVTYDSTVFEVGAIGAGDIGQPVANTAEAGVIRMNGSTLSPQSGEVTIATIPFAVIGAPGDQNFSTFSLTIVDLGDENFEPIDVEAIAASVPLHL